MVAPLLYTKERSLLTIVATILRHKNSRRWRAGNLNAKTDDIHVKMLGIWKLFSTFEKNNYIIE